TTTKTLGQTGCFPVHLSRSSSVSERGKALSRHKEKPPRKGAIGIGKGSLAVARDRAHLPRQEMIRRPRTGHDHLAILELLGGRAVAVLIFFDRLGVDEVGDIEQHSVGIDLLAAD